MADRDARSIRPGGGSRVYGTGAVRFLLVSCPGDPLYDACLAFACGTSLLEMRALTQALLFAEPPEFQQVSDCASCGRLVAAIVYK